MKKNLITILLLAVIQLSLTNCAYIYSKSDNVAAKVNYFAKKQQYGLALETLSFIQQDHYNYVFLMSEKKRISRLAAQYEKSTLEQAENFSKQKHWAEAMHLYDEAINNLPDSKKIKNARAKFIKKRDKYLKQLKNKLLVSSAKTLSKKTATTKEIAQVNPDDSKAKNLLSSHIREVKLTANKLITCAEDSIKNNDIQLAEECLSLASNLSTSEKTSKKIKYLNSKIKKEKTSRRKKNKKSIKVIKMSLAQVKNIPELIRYKKDIQAIYQQDKSNKKIIRLKKELDNRVDGILKKGIKEGQDLYSQGRIQQALNQWNQLYKLKPTDTRLNEYIHRAERVLKKLQSLSNNPNAISPPKAVRK